MKSIRFSVVAATLLLGSFSTVTAQTADDIVQKHIAAIGGAENWKKVNSIKMTASMNAGGMELPITITTVKNKAFRMEFAINGMTNYQILTKTEGWMYFPIQGQQKPEAIPAETVKEQQSSMELEDPLIDYKTKGNKVAYLGKDQVEGTECYKLKLTRTDGKDETMYIDASNYYHIRSVEKTKANGKETEEISNFSNYQKLPEGIVYPMSLETPQGPITVKSVEINKPIDESLFKPSK